MRHVLVTLIVICFSHGESAGYYGQVSSVLKSLYDADNTAHIVPQLISSGVEYPVCYFSTANRNIQPLCKVLCKTAGFQLCERSYAVVPNDRNYADKGFFVDVNCVGDEYNVKQCKWFSIYNSSCHYLLAIKCIDCNNSLTIVGDELSVVTLPQYSPCGVESACEWNIYLKKMERKVTPIKFQSYKNITGNGARMRKRILALSWVDYQEETHFIEGTDENFTAKSLEVASDKFVLHYFAQNCSTLVAQERVQLVINDNRQPTGYMNEESTRLLALILPLCVAVAGITTLIVCICYNIKNKARFQEYRLDAVGSYKGLNCLTGMTSPQKTTVDDYLVTPWGKDYKVHEENDEIQLGSVTKYTINRNNIHDHESERKVETSSTFEVKRKHPFTSNHKIKADTAYSVKRHQLSEVPIPRNSNQRSSLSKQISSETEPTYSCRNSELEPTYSCRSSESEKSYFSVTHYGDADYACSEAGTFISINSEHSAPVTVEEYGSVQSL
ncbi:uncharacterized protein LOC124709304 [Schistocerca piceifrons]|uniref:uncharacterized protein LOC124709304 n=1 Tax=Schistocerca piceifrons TaxID=274613 RepID=UPI001F5F4932|nr:uncharacterized protein LOC124709304 [Schistocerca piceifrons]